MSERLKQYWAVKSAGLTTDAIGAAFLPAALPNIGSVASTAGIVHGATKDDVDVPDNWFGIVPGVGSSRLFRRARKVRKALAPKERYQSMRVVSDAYSPVGTTLMLAALGAGVGAISLRNRKLHIGRTTIRGIGGGSALGAASGVAAGAVINLAAAIAAATTRRRTAEEQADAEKAPGILNWLIPGRGTYNVWKRLGYSKNFDEEKAERDETDQGGMTAP